MVFSTVPWKCRSEQYITHHMSTPLGFRADAGDNSDPSSPPVPTNLGCVSRGGGQWRWKWWQVWWGWSERRRTSGVVPTTAAPLALLGPHISPERKRRSMDWSGLGLKPSYLLFWKSGDFATRVLMEGGGSGCTTGVGDSVGQTRADRRSQGGQPLSPRRGIRRTMFQTGNLTRRRACWGCITYAVISAGGGEIQGKRRKWMGGEDKGGIIRQMS